ncbi:MAG: alpha/beta hydrolase fold protein [Hyphomicrobiales bacterium]|nr:alpha/beta hydrolase fold protein [Hyphomicrobiales bacterium]
MTTRIIDVRGRTVELLEAGSGHPVLYLHDMWDLHTAQAGMFPFHEQLSANFRLIAPAHPGCGDSNSIKEITDIEDLAFHYLDLLNVLGMKAATIVGVGLGGWIATEMAVRNPERIGRLALVGAAGLQMPGALVGDIFMYSQNRDGGIMQELRELLFKDADSDIAHSVVPDGRVNVPDEVRRYKSLTLAGRVGWEPPYLHDRKLLGRLHRIACPTLLIWGEHDRFVPLATGEAYAKHIQVAALHVLAGSGHSAIIEQPKECLDLIAPFLASGILPEGEKRLAD